MTFQPGTAKTINRSLFAATKNCDDSTTLALTFSGLKSDGVTPYSYATDKIGVDSATGSILIDAAVAAGSYFLYVKG